MAFPLFFDLKIILGAIVCNETQITNCDEPPLVFPGRTFQTEVVTWHPQVKKYPDR